MNIFYIITPNLRKMDTHTQIYNSFYTFSNLHP